MHEGCRGDVPGNIPPPGFTQRATIDCDRDEIYVLSGLSKEKEKRDDNIQNSFWVYSIREQKWKCVYKNDNSGENYWRKMQHIEPCPRFAHQLVYDTVKKVYFKILSTDTTARCEPCSPPQYTYKLIHRSNF